MSMKQTTQPVNAQPKTLLRLKTTAIISDILTVSVMMFQKKPSAMPS